MTKIKLRKEKDESNITNFLYFPVSNIDQVLFSHLKEDYHCLEDIDFEQFEILATAHGWKIEIVKK